MKSIQDSSQLVQTITQVYEALKLLAMHSRHNCTSLIIEEGLILVLSPLCSKVANLKRPDKSWTIDDFHFLETAFAIFELPDDVKSLITFGVVGLTL